MTSPFLQLEYERNTPNENLGFQMVYEIQSETKKINYITNTKKIPYVKNESSYKLLRNKLNYVLKFAENKYHRLLIIDHKENTRKSWSVIKRIINKHRKSNIQCKFKLNNGTVTDDKKLYQKISTIFHKYWSTTCKIYPIH